MWGNTIAIDSVFKEKQNKKTILQKKTQKMKKRRRRRRQFWKKKEKQKMKKKHAGKVKVEFSTSSILKNKFNKNN
jgi:hypothetical protein